MSTQHTNENLTVHFKVKDYAAWRTGYDAGEKGRLSAGITNGRVFRNAADPNDVVICKMSRMSERPALGWAPMT